MPLCNYDRLLDGIVSGSVALGTTIVPSCVRYRDLLWQIFSGNAVGALDGADFDILTGSYISKSVMMFLKKLLRKQLAN